MYKEKVVASFIVATLCKQNLKRDEVDVLKALCSRDFHSNNKFVSKVTEMIQDAGERGVDIGSPEFSDQVYNYLVDEISENDQYLKVAMKESDVLHGLIEVADALEELNTAKQNAESAMNFLEQSTKELKELQTPEHVIFYTDLGDEVFVTEHCGGNVTQATLSTENFAKFRKFVEKKGNARLVAA